METATRNKSEQLKIMESLNSRSRLPHSQKQYLLNLKKGFEGEELFDQLIQKHLGTDVLVLNDRLVTYNGSTAQIDALVVIGNILYLYEVKNYEGEYQQLAGQFRRLKGKDFICPSVQLYRTEKVLQQMISQWTESLEICSFVIFVSPDFTLYDARITNPFILPTQISTHFTKLKNAQLQSSIESKRILNKLQSESRSGETYRGTPQEYKYEELKKGLICPDCCSFNLKLSERQAICLDCGRKISADALLLNHMNEIKMLFPETDLTTSLVYEWIAGKFVKRRIGRLLRSLKLNDRDNKSTLCRTRG
ncbi:Nuclease-related domain-containing protein [Alkalibacterium subtropicum]|uniref:Nuclease-related domain-containing protein n=1 Tax=Alkalibacterium subtropicum TaxID=753702 RepID=A0A1I1GP87_9LACT|nr:nuclease-related domain-containing protein [Alkalibacterium subtropicum]SFC13579.1 Nuclease-related domain-containing protein [Alkalibacterium subtropicum]